MKYKDQEIKPTMATAGVKQIDRGQHKGKWRAFFKGEDGIIHSGTPRDYKYQATFDLSLVKARVYVTGDAENEYAREKPEEIP